MATRRIRVLQMGSPTGLYGAERWILALVRNLPRAQVESIIATIKDAPGELPPLCREAAQRGLTTAIFEAHGRLNLRAVGLIRDYVRTNRIDILHTHGYKTDIVGCLAARGTGCRVISTPHGWSTEAGLKLQIYEALDRLAFHFTAAVVPLSADLQAGLRRLPGLRRKLHLIENGVDLSELDADTAPAPELAQWRAANERVIGYIGQLIPRKGVDTLLRGFHKLPFLNRRLCIVGEGPQRAELEALAQELGEAERVRFYGYRADRISLLRGFDMLVLPSSLEGIPRCVLEAMAVGVAVVASDIPGCRRLVDSGRTGLLFDFGDTAGLTAAMARLCTDSVERAAVARAAQARVRAEFSAEAMAGRYLDLYQRVLNVDVSRDAPGADLEEV